MMIPLPHPCNTDEGWDMRILWKICWRLDADESGTTWKGNTYPSLRFEEVEEEKMQQFVEMTEAPAQVNQQLPENTFLCESTPGR
ncbi:hypothetical protein F442_06946 [Phytophthora nicotianae P10297]|uniref:Uncharacterized protein n=1 Tax=Phytophthora nicotianae P10297 TaxID=1317064 RepID=W2ZHW6_PHYNI|nr:hypothetical protein F442_06946 [Phytophthora nicotianae P10297]